MTGARWTVAATTALWLALAAPSWADDLDGNETWSELRQEGLSIVFGRIQGRFDGTDYRGRKIRVRHIETGDEHLIRADEALGFFEATLPVGSYEVVAIEAVYFPSIRPMNPRRFPPVKQRYRVKALSNVGIPTFPVLPEAPIYLGTIRSGVRSEGLVYKGHVLEIIDEFPDALERLANRHPRLMESVQKSGAEPKRYFFLEPKVEESPLEIAALHSPLNQARDYISDRRFDQALSWLATFLPTTDDERIEVQLLVGEALLADKQYIEAIEELGEVLLVEPGRARALRLLARAHAYEGHREDAMSLYRALAEAVPRDAEASLHIGFEYALASEEKLAEAAFTSAFSENFDYLLHDLTPYALALKEEGIDYVPPKIIDGAESGLESDY
jgi:tetratricopeptide (TPR) repeat protein